MEEDQDDKDDTKRRSRNLTEKKRRDQFNSVVSELSALISKDNRRMDKTTVLKSTIDFLKTNETLNQKAKVDDIGEFWKPTFITNKEFTHLALEAIESCIMVVSLSGKIYYISDNASSMLGHNPHDLVNTNLVQMINEEYRSHLMNILHKYTVDMGAWPSHFNGKELSMEYCIRRGTVGSNERNCVYEPIKFHGHLRLNSDYEAKASMGFMPDHDLRFLYVCNARIKSPLRKLRDVSLCDPECTEFVARYSLEWKFIFLDHQAPSVIGYMPFELLGTSAFDYYNSDDLDMVDGWHRELMQTGRMTTSYYRFLTKGRQWIWLQTNSYVTYHQWTAKPEFVVCTHRVISYDDIVKLPKVEIEDMSDDGGNNGNNSNNGYNSNNGNNSNSGYNGNHVNHVNHRNNNDAQPNPKSDPNFLHVPTTMTLKRVRSPSNDRTNFYNARPGSPRNFQTATNIPSSKKKVKAGETFIREGGSSDEEERLSDNQSPEIMPTPASSNTDGKLPRNEEGMPRDGPEWAMPNTNQPSYSDIMLDSNQPSDSDIMLTTDQPSASEMEPDTNQPSASDMMLTTNQPSDSDIMLDHNQPSDSDIMLDTNQPSASEIDLVTNQPSPSNMTLNTNQASDCDIMLTNNQPSTCNIKLNTYQPSDSDIMLTTNKSSPFNNQPSDSDEMRATNQPSAFNMMQTTYQPNPSNMTLTINQPSVSKKVRTTNKRIANEPSASNKVLKTNLSNMMQATDQPSHSNMVQGTNQPSHSNMMQGTNQPSHSNMMQGTNQPSHSNMVQGTNQPSHSNMMQTTNQLSASNMMRATNQPSASNIMQATYQPSHSNMMQTNNQPSAYNMTTPQFLEVTPTAQHSNGARYLEEVHYDQSSFPEQGPRPSHLEPKAYPESPMPSPLPTAMSALMPSGLPSPLSSLILSPMQSLIASPFQPLIASPMHSLIVSPVPSIPSLLLSPNSSLMPSPQRSPIPSPMPSLFLSPMHMGTSDEDDPNDTMFQCNYVHHWQRDDSLHHKQAELQAMIVRQQEEIRLVRQQLLMATVGILPPLVTAQGEYIDPASIQLARVRVPMPTQMPTQIPMEMPTPMPTQTPTQMPTQIPTQLPTQMSTYTEMGYDPHPAPFCYPPQHSYTPQHAHTQQYSHTQQYPHNPQHSDLPQNTPHHPRDQ